MPNCVKLRQKASFCQSQKDRVSLIFQPFLECIGTVKDKADDGIIGAGALTGMVDELVQLIITEITILEGQKV